MSNLHLKFGPLAFVAFTLLTSSPAAYAGHINLNACRVLKKNSAKSLYESYLIIRSNVGLAKEGRRTLTRFSKRFSSEDMALIRSATGPTSSYLNSVLANMIILKEVANAKPEFDETVCNPIIIGNPGSMQPATLIQPEGERCLAVDPYTGHERYFPVDGVWALQIKNDGIEEIAKQPFKVSYGYYSNSPQLGYEFSSETQLDIATGTISWSDPVEQQIFGERKNTNEQLLQMAQADAAKEVERDHPECANSSISPIRAKTRRIHEPAINESKQKMMPDDGLRPTHGSAHAQAGAAR